MTRLRFLFVSVVGLLVVGCAIGFVAIGCSSSSNSPMAHWISAHGGVVTGAYEDRAEAVASPLFASCSGQTITIQVLDLDAPAAYSWPDGHVFVSRGLEDQLTNPELAASIAHEMGHLLNDGKISTVAALQGTDAGLMVEVNADATGVKVLKSNHISPEAMISMLEKVGDSDSLSAHTHRALDQRIAILKNEMQSAKEISVANCHMDSARD